jgi:murein DD-endopeptidase MepM/ murein hydrolase activator NlpD
LYKKAFVEVHEYLADRDCLRNGVCSIDYQNIMLQSVQNRLSNALASGFASSLTLKRIKMMTRIRTSRFAHIKLTLILPVLAILLMSFSFEKAPLDLLSNQPPLTPGNTDPEFVLPVKADKGIYFASGYGNRVHPIERVEKMHNGVDIAGPEGTPILAVANGVISKIVEVKGYGKYLVIDHANGFSSLYAQLSSYAAKQGQTVKRGELIAYMGQSGVSTGPHLHFELRKDGEAVDPSGYLKLNLYSTKK